MKKLFTLVVVLGIFSLAILYNDQIVSFYVRHFTNFQKDSSILANNQYASKNTDYQYVKLMNQFTPFSKNDILNIYYTVLNSGMTDFIFYCPNEYKDCIDDVNYISHNQDVLSHINNFVPVYNSFKKIETEFDSLGKVTIHITHSYEPEKILAIENKVKEVIDEVTTKDMKKEEKIKKIHDYIINHTKYDVERSDNKVTTYESDTAYGALIQNYAICGGYADSMKLFLDYLEIPNYKIASENHIWNLVFLEDQWYHLDLTWDDPVTSTGDDVLEYDYFLITTEELKKIATEQHIYDENIYIETKSN